jgi:hypothetical protein
VTFSSAFASRSPCQALLLKSGVIWAVWTRVLWQDTDGVVGHLPGTMGDTAGDGGKGIYHQLTKQEMDERAISAPPVLEFTAKVTSPMLQALHRVPVCPERSQCCGVPCGADL